ncbi:MAG: type I methionyl aminopeptidase [bacterium]
MIIIKTRDEIRQMRESCRVAARVRDELARQVTPGMTTRALDQQAARLIAAMGGKSAFLGYRGYPGNICLSIDDEVVHGIPSDRRIEMGQIVSLDVGVVYGGFVGDTATTVMVGVTDPEVVRLVRTTEQALVEGIAMARTGKRLSDISSAIERAAVRAGFSVVRDFVGHGIGRSMHEDPQIPNFGKPGHGPKLKVGMTFAIEPMVNMGGGAVEVMADGWTVLTADRKPSAHFEHTVAIGEDGPEILTVAA